MPGNSSALDCFCAPPSQTHCLLVQFLSFDAVANLRIVAHNSLHFILLKIPSVLFYSTPWWISEADEMSRTKITKVTTATMAQLYKSRSRAILFQVDSIFLGLYFSLQNIDTRALCRYPEQYIWAKMHLTEILTHTLPLRNSWNRTFPEIDL